MPNNRGSRVDVQRARSRQRPARRVRDDRRQATEIESASSFQAVESASRDSEGALHTAYPASLLGDPRLSMTGNSPARIGLMTQMQQTYGNRAVQRFLRRGMARTPSPSGTSTQSLPGPGMASPAPIQRQTPWEGAEKGGATSKETTAPTDKGWNAGEVEVGHIWRIPVGGLDQGNKRDDTKESAGYDHKSTVGEVTSEKAMGEAIVLVPEKIANTKEVDVLLYMHGFGSGYRQRKTSREKEVGKGKQKHMVTDPGMDAGSVRDVDVDHMEAQLQATIEASGRPMVGVLPQGAYITTYEGKGKEKRVKDLSFGNDFNSDKYLEDIFQKTDRLQGVTRGRVVLAGHSGAGGTINRLLAQATEKPQSSRLPEKLAEVALFDAINGPGELSQLEEWLEAQINKDAANLRALKDPEAQKTYLQGSMRFRGFHSDSPDYYTPTYNTLKADVHRFITNAVAAPKPRGKRAKGTAPAEPEQKLSSDLEGALRDNYENGIQAVDTSHEYLMGEGKGRVKEALGALPKVGAGGASPSPTPLQKQPAPGHIQEPAPSQAVQRDAPGTPGATGSPLSTEADITQALIAEAVQIAGNKGTLLRGPDIETALQGRATDTELSSAFDTSLQAVKTTPLQGQAAAIHAQSLSLVHLLELHFIHNPKASSLDLLPPDQAKRYRNFKWDRLDFPGQTGSDPEGPNEDRARDMARDLSKIRPEHKPHFGSEAVLVEEDFTKKMQKYVISELKPVPGQDGMQLNRLALESFIRMSAAAKADGVDLVIDNSWRSYETAKANAAKSGNRSAVASFSAHTLGLAIDFIMSHAKQQYDEVTTRPMQNVVNMRQSPVHKWLFLHGAEYDWNPYQNEPWHFEYNPSGFREQFLENVTAAATTDKKPAQRSVDTSATPASNVTTQRSIQRQPASREMGPQFAVQRDKGAPGSVGTAEKGDAGGDKAAADAVEISFGANAVQSAVSEYSLSILRDVARAAGLKKVNISSTARTANDQARVMYENLESHGVAHQKELYGAAGDKVIDVYVASKAAKKTATEIKADMQAKIEELGPPNVSRHCADPTKLNVFDVAPSSIGDDKANKAFVKAAQAEVGGRISNFIPYPKDPGQHFEIVPK